MFFRHERRHVSGRARRCRSSAASAGRYRGGAGTWARGWRFRGSSAAASRRPRWMCGWTGKKNCRAKNTGPSRMKMWRGRPRPRSSTTSTSMITTHDHHHDHEHHREHEHLRDDEPRGRGAPAPHEHSTTSHAHGRGLTEIREIIAKAAISDTAKKTAIAIFEAWGRRRPRFTPRPSRRCTSTKWARWMRWSTSSARRSEPRPWEWTRSSALR